MVKKKLRPNGTSARKHAGRPRVGSGRTTMLGVVLPASLKAAVDQAAADRKMSSSEFARTLIAQALASGTFTQVDSSVEPNQVAVRRAMRAVTRVKQGYTVDIDGVQVLIRRLTPSASDQRKLRLPRVLFEGPFNFHSTLREAISEAVVAVAEHGEGLNG